MPYPVEQFSGQCIRVLIVWYLAIDHPSVSCSGLHNHRAISLTARYPVLLPLFATSSIQAERRFHPPRGPGRCLRGAELWFHPPRGPPVLCGLEARLLAGRNPVRFLCGVETPQDETNVATSSAGQLEWIHNEVTNVCAPPRVCDMKKAIRALYDSRVGKLSLPSLQEKRITPRVPLVRG